MRREGSWGCGFIDLCALSGIARPVHVVLLPELTLSLLPFILSSISLPPVSGAVKRQVAVKSTRGIALKNSHGLMVKTGGAGIGPGGGPGGHGGAQGKGGDGGDSGPKNTRLFFDGEESCYIIDAKLEGNLGRYLNVSVICVCHFLLAGNSWLLSD